MFLVICDIVFSCAVLAIICHIIILDPKRRDIKAQAQIAENVNSAT